MEKEMIISGAAAGISVAALVLAGITSSTVNQTRAAVSFDTTVNVATANTQATDTTANTETTTESGDGTEAEETTVQADATGYTGSTNIVLEDGVIKLKDSVIKVPATGSNDSTAGDVYLYLPGTNVVTYDSTTGYLILNDTTIVRTISTYDATYQGISKFTNSDLETVLIGEKVINDDTSIAVVHTIPGSAGVDADIATETQAVQDILDGTFSNVTVTSASLFGYDINPEWVEDMIIADEGLEMIKGSKAIYVTPYTGSFASGATQTLKAGSVSLTYSENIRDDSTGYTPYIIEYSETQDGTSTSSKTTLQAKILAQSNLDATDLFTTKD